MNAHASESRIDPLAAFMAGAWTAGTKRPVPLVATKFAVSIEAGLAIVETTRRFHNAEDRSIEATVTFPLPVHATLFSLKARIGERLLTAHAESRTGARQTYETAIEEGHSAVLHEEVLRGVHMLSVAHVPPGADIEVTTQWAMTVSVAGEGASLHIPLTVGDIYGQSPLPESDALVHGGPMQGAELLVLSADAAVELIGGRLEGGPFEGKRAFVPLDAPIDLRLSSWTPRELCGRAADGREVALRIERLHAGPQAIDAAILVDRSGSMNDLCSVASGSTTKHDAVIDGLVAISGRLEGRDGVDVWEFANAVSHVGSTGVLPRAVRSADAVHQTPQARLLALAEQLTAPAGGTEIGQALAEVLRQSRSRDVLLITDGKSHALDVQKLAAAGRRISVVLVGEDSLEAHVGHLAALTGGEIFVAAGADLSDAMVASLATLRRAHEAVGLVPATPQYIAGYRNGLAFTAEWRTASRPVEEGALGRAVAAFAAGLALPGLELKAATRLAVAEGLVTHLTSLALVDEAGPVQEDLPEARKVALPTPRTTHAAVSDNFGHGRTRAVAVEISRRASPAAAAPRAAQAAAPVHRSRQVSLRSAETEGPTRSMTDARRRLAEEEHRRRLAEDTRRRSTAVVTKRVDLSTIGPGINWARMPGDPSWLSAGDLSWLNPGVVRLIENAAGLPEVVALAGRLGLPPVVLVAALLARRGAPRGSSTEQAAKDLLAAASPTDIESVKAMLGLS